MYLAGGWEAQVHWALGFDAISLGEYEEARRAAERGMAIGEQVAYELFRALGFV
jgi:hypothetical protein